MKAAEATDSLRANKTTGKLADDLPCNARHLSLDGFDVLSDKNVKRGGDSMNCAASTTTCKLPNSHAESKKEGPWGPVLHPPPDSVSDTRDQVLINLLQTGGIKSKCAPLASVASMERRRRYCSCSELTSFHSSKNALLSTNGNREPASNSSCNCNMENCAWVPSHPCSEEAFSSSFKSQSWRSSSDQSTTNAALHRALAAMKKVSGEPDAVKKSQHKSRGMNDRGNILPVPCEIETNGRSITNSDARTLSMRERGRWGNSKMQQQLFGGTPATHPSCTTGGQNVKPNVSSDNHQALQHVQCLHCGSFSTTPVSSAAKGTRSHSFGRRVRDYSWQQELQQEHKRPEQHAKEVIGGRPLSQSGRPAGAQNGNVHHQCEYARCADELPEYEAGVAGMKLQHQGGTMSWQERYMLLCQAIAAGAFVDGAPDDSSGQLMPPSRGYSWAVCECTACEMGGERSFRRAAASANYCSTSSGERMMELEAFSGPLGYVSESKGTELNGLMEKRAARRGISRWWARLPSFGKAKSSSTAQGGGQKNAAWAAGQNTAQCSACGQRVWARGEEELGARLCPDCLGRAGGATCEGGPIPPPAARPTPPSAARSRSFQPPPFSNFSSHHHKSLPRRWRLMKLCRYLMGFPLQR